jgi:hypothetical protein
MKTFELEIPGRLNWKFADAREAVLRGAKLLVPSVPRANLYSLGEMEVRMGMVLSLVRTGEKCPDCGGDEGLIRLSGNLDEYDESSICRHCERVFKG